jgi:hypothetical protein
LNNDLQNTTGTQKTKGWTMIYKILLVHRKLKIEQWSTQYYWYRKIKIEQWSTKYYWYRKLKIEQWSTKYYWYTEN